MSIFIINFLLIILNNKLDHEYFYDKIFILYMGIQNIFYVKMDPPV